MKDAFAMINGEGGNFIDKLSSSIRPVDSNKSLCDSTVGQLAP
jgi:hypothetical protein